MHFLDCYTYPYTLLLKNSLYNFFIGAFYKKWCTAVQHIDFTRTLPYIAVQDIDLIKSL